MREDADKIFSKIVCISGDVTENDLGIQPENISKLLDEITVVFHSAATVKFNESLETAITLNTIGTQRVLLFCQKMNKLKVINFTQIIHMFAFGI